MKKLTNKQRVSKLRALLVRACNKEIRAGKKIYVGNFKSDYGDCCPIQCAVGKDIDSGYSVALSKKLKFNFHEQDMWDFISGFDGGSKYQLQKIKDPFFKLGVSLREKYIEEPVKGKK